MNINNKYIQYETQPHIINIDEIEGNGDDSITVRLKTSRCKFLLKKNKFTSDHIFNLLEPTMLGLMEDLVPGSLIMEKFLIEFDRYQSKKTVKKDFSYGEWVYYPRHNHLVRYAPRFWHQLSLLVRNSTLYRDKKFKMEWNKIRKVFQGTVIAVAGCSVGNNAVHALVRDLRPVHIKIADVKAYRLPNANRVHLTYEDFGRNKAQVTAEQIHAVDPFISISVYSDGVHEGNINDFICGNARIHEPRASVIVEETDDPDMKILIREEARRNAIPVVMVSDIGSAAQIDVRRFDLNQKISLAPNVSDTELFKKRDRWRKDLANREKFFEFTFSLIGHHYKHISEFKSIVLKEEPPLFGGIPQLGSTAMMAGGIVAETIGRMMLGDVRPERMFIDKNKGIVIVK